MRLSLFFRGAITNVRRDFVTAYVFYGYTYLYGERLDNHLAGTKQALKYLKRK